MAAGVLTHF
jgi:hypothetical protein